MLADNINVIVSVCYIELLLLSVCYYQVQVVFEIRQVDIIILIL
jgi:hypothetical protein